MKADQLKKEGIFTVIVGVVLIGCALILSDGYDPRGGAALESVERNVSVQPHLWL